MNFEAIISSTELSEQPCRLSVPNTWSQGRTVFGGLSAALMLKHMYIQLNDQDRQLLSFSCNFVAPLIASEPFTINTSILRQGKNVTQLESRIEQRDSVCLVSLASFAKQRPSNIKVKSQIKPAILNTDINEENTIQYVEGIFPAFIQHVDLNIQAGAMPFSGADSSELHGWMKFKQMPQKTAQELYILALADAWPPTLLQLCNKPSPASTVSWYIEFLQPLELSTHDWVGYEAITHQASNGYGIEDAKVFSKAGDLIALSRQTVAVFDG
ncbi:thioesterase family protein [Pseudoalteromonas luteoviolacea]|uniref:thioesterase family protein n=1 Tax=Pseudoalteromonas luteoviolacea TaxID=43657 RepID=UPI001F2ADADB|nr:thioesterase family protein [Pseudoalteromonas luteoviolacea]MCF6439618.1 thioesterase family protein [Pseudoalteromonas luteoviolacea]